MLTHCPKFSIFECRFCGKRGEDCLRTCTDCMELNPLKVPFEDWRIHFRDTDEDLLYLARILCKRCSLWHIRNSLGARIFDVHIFRSSCYPDRDQKWISICGGSTSTYIPTDLVIREEEKPSYTGLSTDGSRLVCGWTCTACHFHHSSGMCKLCRAVNENRKKDRIRLINGHLHIINAYCQWHNFGIYPIYHHHYMIQPSISSVIVRPTPIRRFHPYTNDQVKQMRNVRNN